MAGVFARGTMKPPLGAQINGAHPFTSGLLFAMLFNQTHPLVNSGVFTDMVQSVGAPPLQVTAAGPTPTWASNREGSALSITDQTTSFRVEPSGTGTYQWLPSAACTVTFVRRRTNATLNTKVMANSAGDLVIYCPFIDGTVYWDYGGTSGAHRLSLGGLSFSTTAVDRWIFTAGPQGSSFWRNGVKLASQATAITRTADTSYLTCNVTDYNEFNFIQIHTVQWSDPLCAWWSAEPYAHLYPDTARAYDFLAPSGPTVIESVGTAAGVATVAGVGAYRTGHPKSGFGAQKKARRHNR